MATISLISLWISINNLTVIFIEKLTRFMKTTDDTPYHPPLPNKLYIFVIIIGVPLFLFINPIKRFRKEQYKLQRYKHLQFMISSFPTLYSSKFERSQSVIDNETELNNLERYFKLKQLTKKKWWIW